MGEGCRAMRFTLERSFRSAASSKHEHYFTQQRATKNLFGSMIRKQHIQSGVLGEPTAIAVRRAEYAR